jgi:hypothetical protein
MTNTSEPEDIVGVATSAASDFRQRQESDRAPAALGLPRVPGHIKGLERGSSMKMLENLRAKSHSIATAITRATGAMFRLRVALPLAAACLLTAGGAVAAASSANATTYSVLIRPGGVSTDYACTEGHTFHNGFPQLIATVENNCAVRIWLHQNNNNSGTSWCFPKGITSIVSSIQWQNLYVADVALPCPSGSTPP